MCADQDNLPYSNVNREGFENRIIGLLAQTLHAKLTYLWLPKLRNANQDMLLLEEGRCDAFLDVGDGQSGYQTTIAYYAGTYVFVYRADAGLAVHSLDDTILGKLRIGVVSASPPDVALATRGLMQHLVHYDPVPRDPTKAMLNDVVANKIDVAVVWGPEAGYLVKETGREADLKVVPVVPQVDMSGLAFVYPVSMGLREGDRELADLLDRALAEDWNKVAAVLKEFNVIVEPLPQPTVGPGG